MLPTITHEIPGRRLTAVRSVTCARYAGRLRGRFGGQPVGERPRGIVVISPEGDHPGTVRLPEQPASAAFGNDGRTL